MKETSELSRDSNDWIHLWEMTSRHLPLLIRPGSVGTALLYVFYNDNLVIIDELAADQIFVNAVKP